MLRFFQSFLMALTRRADLALAVMLIAIIFMMILPLPTWVVDVLIAINMAIAVVLLMVGIYIQSPLSFSSLPSVLLLSTLFRLALSITTTRLILLQADAGAIVETFGNFVVAGNLVVGLVIFLIITLVQFIVITKGSERVAEVGARFSLDGMPGKQMSIDSDMRAGVITMAQALKRRSNLEKESQLYGAMDGAMKFVKGDAIAGLVIIIVNIIGGISVGVFQQGMDTGDALQLYSVLTVGDGLVAQIPALFIAITSGIIVTRVTSDDAVNLGTDIGNQVLDQPNALLIGGLILFGFALIPGFPTVIFITLSFAIGLMGFTLSRQRKRQLDPLAEEVPAMAPTGRVGTFAQADGDVGAPPAAPLIIEVAEAAKAVMTPELLNTELAKVRRALYQDLGVPFPGVHLRFDSALDEDGYAILLQEIPMAKGRLGTHQVFVAHSAEELKLLGIPVESEEDFLPNLPTLLINEQYADTLRANGIDVLSAPRIICHHLAHVLSKHASQFVGIQEAHYLLEQIGVQYGELVKEALRAVPLSKVADILRRLVAEEVSIRDMRSILEGLVEWGQQEENTEQLSEYVRTHLKRQISYRFSAGKNILPAYIIDPAIEGTLREHIRQTPTGSSLALDPEATHDLIESIRQNIKANSTQQERVVLLSSLDLRRHLRKLIEIDFHDLPVLSYQELAPEITVQPLGKIGFSSASA